MDYIRTDATEQLVYEHSPEYLLIPSFLHGFHNSKTTEETTRSGRSLFVHFGSLDVSAEERICEHCGSLMHINAHPDITLHHLPVGEHLSVLRLPHNQLRCPHCGATKGQHISFKVEGHRMTGQLYQYVRDLLALNTFTNKQISEITGLGKNVVKKIDLQRLKERYTFDGKLVQPEHEVRFLGIDEFLLHKGHRYATIIIDLESGHILWLAYGKKKQVVYDFIDHVGLEWMDSVEAVACDMNSDFQEAFEECCPHVQPVFDYFHIVKNFNDKVVNEVRKAEQRRLQEEGDIEAAQSLKRTRYILTSNRSTLQRKDAEAAEGKILRKGSELFGSEDIVRKGGSEQKYDDLLAQNKLLFTLDLVKVKLADAYSEKDEPRMAEKISDLIDLCEATDCNPLRWFGKLLTTHFEGIIAHATYPISSGKVEGINQRIKTLRRQGYGYPDDEYFFLKLFDMSRTGCPR